jgi:WD40 repeat protein
METGAELFKFQFNEPARASKFSVGEKLAAVSTDPFMNSKSAIRFFRIAEDPREQSGEEILQLTGPVGRITRVHWVDGNRTLLSSSEDGIVRRWDVETGKCVAQETLHKKQISDMQMSADGTHFITASIDSTAKLVDTQVRHQGTAVLQMVLRYGTTWGGLWTGSAAGRACCQAGRVPTGCLCRRVCTLAIHPLLTSPTTHHTSLAPADL